MNYALNQSAELARLRMAMLNRGWDSHRLAQKARIHLRVAQNVLCGNDKSWPPRAAFNRVLAERIFQKHPGAQHHHQRRTGKSTRL